MDESSVANVLETLYDAIVTNTTVDDQTSSNLDIIENTLKELANCSVSFFY